LRRRRPLKAAANEPHGLLQNRTMFSINSALVRCCQTTFDLSSRQTSKIRSCSRDSTFTKSQANSDKVDGLGSGHRFASGDTFSARSTILEMFVIDCRNLRWGIPDMWLADNISRQKAIVLGSGGEAARGVDRNCALPDQNAAEPWPRCMRIVVWNDSQL